MTTLSDIILGTEGCIIFSVLSSPLTNLVGSGLIKENGTVKYDNVFGEIATAYTNPRSIGGTNEFDYPYITESEFLDIKSCEIIFKVQDSVVDEYAGIISTNYVQDVSRALFLIFPDGAIGWYLLDLEISNVESDIHSLSSLSGSGWTHLVLNYENGNTYAYINGEKDESLTIPYNFFSIANHGDLTLLGFPNPNGVAPYGGGVSGTHFAAYDRSLSETQIQERVSYMYSLNEELNCYLYPLNVTWFNKESESDANQYPDEVQSLNVDCNLRLAEKLGNYKSAFNQQGEHRNRGYYQSTVTVSDIPKPNTRVLCFTNDGQLLDETYSNESGVYRFDHLLMDYKYLFVAQYNNGNPKVAPDYLAAAADWQTPTAYGSD